MTNLNAVFPKGDVFVGQEAADVVDEGDVVTNEEDIPDGRIILFQHSGAMDQDQRLAAS